MACCKLFNELPLAPKIPRLTFVSLSPSPYAVHVAHHLLFVLLPVALVARLALRPRPPVIDVARGVMRFCLGTGKAVLLIHPLWHLASMVLRGGPGSLSASVAWTGFLALMLALHFVMTAAGDLAAGLGGMFGITLTDKVEDVFSMRRVNHGNLLRHLLAMIVLAGVATLAHGTWQPLAALFSPAPRSIATVFQETRVWTDFHVVTMIAGFACLLGLPWSRDFLRAPLPWKGVICLCVFFLAAVMLWTRVSPM